MGRGEQARGGRRSNGELTRGEPRPYRRTRTMETSWAIGDGPRQPASQSWSSGRSSRQPNDGPLVIREAADAQPTQAVGPERPWDARQGAGHEGQLVGARREPAGQGVRVQIVLGRFGSRRASALMIRGRARPLATDQTNVLSSRPTLESALITATRNHRAHLPIAVCFGPTGEPAGRSALGERRTED